MGRDEHQPEVVWQGDDCRVVVAWRYDDARAPDVGTLVPKVIVEVYCGHDAMGTPRWGDLDARTSSGALQAELVANAIARELVRRSR